MERYRKVISDFFMCCEAGDWDQCRDLVHEDVRLESTLVGTCQGIEKIRGAMRFPEEHNISNAVITNLIHREAEGHDLVWCYMHHMTGIYQEKQLFPLVYGGKLYFDLCGSRIEKIRFELCYEYGNTWMMHSCWKFYEETKNMRLVRTDIFRRDGEARSIEDTVNLFFLAVDSMDKTLFRAVCSRDVRIVKSGIDSNIYTENGVLDVDRYLRFEREFYEQNLYSVHIADQTDIDAFHKKITCWHLSPGRPGTKHYGTNTIFMQFYDEVIDVELYRDPCGWKIESVTFTAKSNQMEYSPKLLVL